MVKMRHTVDGSCSSVRSVKLLVNRGVPQGPVLDLCYLCFSQLNLLLTQDLSADYTVLSTLNKGKDELEVQSYIALNTAVDYCIMNDLDFNQMNALMCMLI